MPNKAPIGSTTYSDTEATTGKYPYIDIKNTESGHFFLMDDTPDNERVRLQHRTASHIEFQPDGSHEMVVYGDSFEVVIKDKSVIINGTCNIEVHGDAKLHVYGDMYNQIDGKLYMSYGGDANIKAEGDINVLAGQEVNIDAGATEGDITLTCQNAVQINADLIVSGSITSGASINATTNLTCGYKVFSQGGIDSIGGINCGFTEDGPENAIGEIVSNVSMTTPFVHAYDQVTSDGMVNDFLSSMQDMRDTYNGHNHVAEGGTSAALQPMF
jgi:hypothetical protein